MKKLFKILALSLFSISNSYAQYNLKDVDDVKWYANIPQENIYLDSNTSLVFSGENLYYKIYCINSSTKQFSNNSKVAYIELVGKQGAVFKHKILLENGQGQGYYFVPTEVKTGNYKLIAYTQWMKNGQGKNYFETDIHIVNPYAKINFDDAAESDAQINIESNTSNLLTLNTNQEDYGTRQEVILEIDKTSIDDMQGRYTISVKKLHDLESVVSSKNFLTLENELSKIDRSISREVGERIYLPEYSGEMISGKIIDKASNSPAVSKKVALSILSDEAYQDIVLTNKQGVFYFNLKNRFSDKNAILQVLDDNKDAYSITVYEHESIDYSKLVFNDSKIHPKFKESIIERSINNQIQNAYSLVKQDKTLEPEYPELFYGNHQFTFNLDDYKRFKTVAETLAEVIDHAWHERRGGKTRFFKVREFENSPYFGADLLPMVVVDGALVQDHESALYFDASKVKSISVLRDEFYYGDLVYQGAVYIKTYENDFLEAINGDHVKKINLFSPELTSKPFRQNYNDEEPLDRIPDYRHQLLWYPNFYFDNNPTKVKFFTSDNTGTYQVIVNGITNLGKPVSIKKTFEVK